MSPNILRFGLHNFLNAQPLLVPLLRHQKELGLEITHDVPSALAEKLNSAMLDIAMIPTIEYLRNTERYRLIPGIAIASRNTVGTVLLVSQVPLQKIKTLALDVRSRTSVALLKVLFASKFSKDIEFAPSPPDPKTMLEENDAALIIGDQAFNLPQLPDNAEIYDLSEEWFRETGKTFVHAVLAIREGVVLSQEFCGKIQSAKQEGVREITDIADRHSRSSGLSLETCEDYLRHKIIYDLGEPELAGMTLFRDRCCERGMIPPNSEIRFVTS